MAISNGPFYDTYTYSTDDYLNPGQRVEVDFAGRVIVGYVIRTGLAVPDFPTKPIRVIIDKEAYLSSIDLELAEYCERRFIMPPGKIFDLFFPPGKIIESKRFLVPFDDDSPLCKSLLYEQGIREYGLEKITDWIESGCVRISHSFVSKKSWPNKKHFLSLRARLDELDDIQLTEQGRRIVTYLLGTDKIEVSDLVKNLSLSNRSPINTLEKKGIVQISEEIQSGSDWIIGAVGDLTPQQMAAYRSIMETPQGLHLLYGLTGTGKTEVYFKVMDYYLNRGKQILYLVPEVSLTPQLMARIRGAFPGRIIGEYNSYLTRGKRQSVWLDAVEGNMDIVVGTRSSVWIPMKRIGLIVVDEEHDGSFYQQSSPHYDGVDIAMEKGKLLGIPVILGSATPRVTHFYRAMNGELILNKLTDRPLGSLPETEVVSLKSKTSHSLIARESLIAINETLKRQKQVFVFVHRKGFSNYVVCMSCGNILKCKNCDVSLTYHRDSNVLKCHYCNHTEVPATICPSCGAKTLVARGFGTEKVEHELRKIFPDAKTLRMDRETVKEPREYENALRMIEKKEVQIVVGTKMIAKGLDFPDVELVIVVDTDRLMSIPRYDSLENSFQLISQVSGRSGRGGMGRSIIQTFNPDHYVLDFALKNDFYGFYLTEIETREALHYPPFSRIVEIIVQNKLEERCNERADKVFNDLSELGEEYEVYGPIEPSIKRIQGVSRRMIILKVPNDKSLKPLLSVLKKYSADVDILVDGIGGIL